MINKAMIKPIIGVRDFKVIYVIYFARFQYHLASLKNNENSFDDLILSGLFLSLTLEAYLTYVIEQLLEYVNRGSYRRVRNLWVHNFRDSAFLDKKFSFFSDIFLSDHECLEERKQIDSFIKDRMRPLRNKIIHTHEHWAERWSDGSESRSALASILTPAKIYELSIEFKERIKQLELMIDKVDMGDTDTNSRQTILAALRFN